jgi:hypothetical protein
MAERRRVAVLGLSSVGKSTLVAALHGKPLQNATPTGGCNKSSLSRHSLLLDLLDLGGSPQVRKFWSQLACDVHAFMVVANASEADDMSWAMLASELRRLRGGRPVLVLLNQRDAAPTVCVSVGEALDRLGIGSGRGIHIETLASSSDNAAAESGLTWLCAELLGGDSNERLTPPGAALPPRAALASSSEATARTEDSGALPCAAEDGTAPSQRVRAPRLRVVQALQDARQFAGPEAELAAALAQKLASGHLLSTEELAKLRERSAQAD